MKPARFPVLWCGLTSVLLVACGQSSPPPPAPLAPAASLSPELQQRYDSSCRTCHGVPGTGAPQTGDAAAWASRLTQGREVLLGHVINGYQKMPPMGLCMECTEEEFLALTEHMAGSTLP
jgi:cytochrome c5